ncbi:hypothetical protein K435DRAFT_963060 [Dendrothele bispora CBS 962.96]|uniref:Uncharacterized protein n=1 Tax=Dendrothele bispora (strain CBS 962.96) TaxID=1314807 RepID=A0A4S8MJG9_DENBC|nr:hypothetical protein K435DRAFT_963060 [Dendrothele bispora CBS 962.96]
MFDTCPTAEELNDNHELLLHRRPGTARPSSSYDAASGAVVPGGRQFVTTPYNGLELYAPSFVVQHMKIRANWRFAEHDYLEWPQMFVSTLCHLACVLHRPAGQHPLSIMWWNMKPGDFVPERRGICAGFGKLKSSVLSDLRQTVSDLAERTKTFCSRRTNSSETELAQKYLRLLLDRELRLAKLTTTFSQTSGGVAALQRTFLELHALLDYCETYKPRMEGRSEAASERAPVIGAFVSDYNRASQLFRAGIPFWFIHPVQSLPRVSVAELAPFVSVDTMCQIECEFGAPVIYSGVQDLEAQYRAITEYTEAFFQTYTPFAAHCQPSLGGSSTSGPLRTHGTDRARPMPYQKRPRNSGGRDKFSLPAHSLYPPFSLVWARALADVDRSELPTEFQRGYAFPDPQLFVSVQTRQRTLTRPSPSAISNSDWRQLLLGDFQPPPESKSSSRSAKTKANVRELLGNCLLESGIEFNLTDPPGDIQWRDLVIKPDMVISDVMVREVIWELSHLNFRCELKFLDNLLTPRQRQTEQHQRHLNECFFGPEVGEFLDVNFEKADEGFAARVPMLRKKHLFSLRNVMLAWEGSVSRCRSIRNIARDSIHNDLTLEAFEKNVIRTYTQCFFDKFGRAATTPLRL